MTVREKSFPREVVETKNRAQTERILDLVKQKHLHLIMFCSVTTLCGIKVAKMFFHNLSL